MDVRSVYFGRRFLFSGIFSVALFANFFAGAAIAVPPGGKENALQLTSAAFKSGAPIPAQYTCEGKNISPPLKWTGAPANAKSFVLIVDDPDAPSGDWVHWVVYDISGTELPEDLPKSPAASDAKQGLNDFKQPGYGGPCPPPGRSHRYFFKLYALDTMLNLKPGATRAEVETAMAKHIVGQTHLMGTYQRK